MNIDDLVEIGAQAMAARHKGYPRNRANYWRPEARELIAAVLPALVQDLMDRPARKDCRWRRGVQVRRR